MESTKLEDSETCGRYFRTLDLLALWQYCITLIQTQMFPCFMMDTAVFSFQHLLGKHLQMNMIHFDQNMWLLRWRHFCIGTRNTGQIIVAHSFNNMEASISGYKWRDIFGRNTRQFGWWDTSRIYSNDNIAHNLWFNIEALSDYICCIIIVSCCRLND